MAQAIRRTNIAGIQRRRRTKPVSRFWRAVGNFVCGLLVLATCLAAPMVVGMLLSAEAGETAGVITPK